MTDFAKFTIVSISVMVLFIALIIFACVKAVSWVGDTYDEYQVAQERCIPGEVVNSSVTEDYAICKYADGTTKKIKLGVQNEN